jgi:hypothetical protein
MPSFLVVGMSNRRRTTTSESPSKTTGHHTTTRRGIEVVITTSRTGRNTGADGTDTDTVETQMGVRAQPVE